MMMDAAASTDARMSSPVEKRQDDILERREVCDVE